MIVAGDAHCWAVAQIRDVRVSASGINACQPCPAGGGDAVPGFYCSWGIASLFLFILFIDTPYATLVITL